MALRTLYTLKLSLWPLIARSEFAGDCGQMPRLYMNHKNDNLTTMQHATQPQTGNAQRKPKWHVGLACYFFYFNFELQIYLTYSLT
jgi:hypothetical protein